MKTIPIEKQPNQRFTVRINDKNVQIELITRGLFMYANISVENEPLFSGVICLNGVNIIRYPNKKLNCKIFFKDTQGEEDPVWLGLGDRWVLIVEE